MVNTFVIDTQRTFTTAISQYNDNRGSQVNAAQIQADIRKYYSDIETFYTRGEDVNQIFDAAYDDAQWVVLEWLEAIKFVNQYDAYSRSSFGQKDVAEFAHRAHIFYNIVQNQFNTSLCEGGLTWNPALAPYKNAITNELFISSSIGMYLYFPGDNNSDPYPSTTYSNRTLPPLPNLKPHDPLLLTNAKEEWAWFKSHNFTNAQGLLVDGFHISDGQTTCDERNEMVYTYNQGVMLSGLRGLWEATGDTSYLQDGYGFINTVINATGWNANGYGQAGQWAGLGRNGIMEDYCDAPANCSQDNLIFKGAYFEHLDLFCEPLPTQTPLVKGLTYLADQGLANSHAQKCRSYASWIQHNAYAALSTRNATSDIIGEWWGASYVSSQSLSHHTSKFARLIPSPQVNRTQTPSPKYTHPKPYGSVDIANKPWLLTQPPWVCYGQGDCESYVGKVLIGERRRRSRKRQATAEQVSTVETQAQGLSVVRAAANSVLQRRAYADLVGGGGR